MSTYPLAPPLISCSAPNPSLSFPSARLCASPPQVIGIFINRLSDYLFVAARLDACSAGAMDQEYKIDFRVNRWQRQVVPVAPSVAL